MLSILPLTHAISYYQGEFFLIYENDSATYLSRVGGMNSPKIQLKRIF